MTTNAVHDVIRTAIADLKPRIEIHRVNITDAQLALKANQYELDSLLAQQAELEAALPDDEPETDGVPHSIMDGIDTSATD